MTAKDSYIRVAKQLREYFDSFGLAFKTYKTTEIDDMIKTIAGDGARVSTQKTAEEMESSLQARGLLCFPSLSQAADSDGYVRIYRAGSVAGNLLQAFLYPGVSGDADLSSLLRALKRGRTGDAHEETGSE